MVVRTRYNTELAGELLDLAVQFVKFIPSTPEGTTQSLVRRAGQTLRLVAQLVVQGTYDAELGRAWLDAGRMTLNRLTEVSRAHQ